MASIADVITMGYGSFGSVNDLPTLGYGLGVVVSNPFDRPCLTMADSLDSASMVDSEISASMAETGEILVAMTEVGCDG